MSLDLAELADRFASDLTATVRQVAPECEPFRARVNNGSGGGVRLHVRQDPATGIQLLVDGQPHITLKVVYWCCSDSSGNFLAVYESSVAVFPGAVAQGAPLFRYEYERTAVNKPAAHVHIHADRPEIDDVLERAGRTTKIGKARAGGHKDNKLWDVHFPVGGDRFRPCLEDVLLMLIDELGVTHDAAARAALLQGQEDWRLKQLRAVIRDRQPEAIAMIRDLGYRVEGDGSATTPNERFTAL